MSCGYLEILFQDPLFSMSQAFSGRSEIGIHFPWLHTSCPSLERRSRMCCQRAFLAPNNERRSEKRCFGRDLAEYMIQILDVMHFHVLGNQHNSDFAQTCCCKSLCRLWCKIGAEALGHQIEWCVAAFKSPGSIPYQGSSQPGWNFASHLSLDWLRTLFCCLENDGLVWWSSHDWIESKH